MSTFLEAPDVKDPPAPDRSQSPSPQRILVVDDDKHIRQLCSEVLIHSGYRVDTAEDGEAGWSVLHGARYDPGSHDLLITDNNMPKLSGVELVRKIRSAYMALPVILASGTAPVNAEWLHAAESLQLAAILPKPYSPAELVQTVKEVMHIAKNKNSATPKLRRCARRLLAYEGASGKPADTNDTAASRVCENLRTPLSRLLGVGGFRSLLYRALALAGVEVPWLRALQIKTDGTLEGLSEVEAKVDSRAVVEGEVVLLAQLLGLLVTFIGPALTQQLLHDIWPELYDLNFG